MKFVPKNPEPDALIELKAAATENWQPDFSDLFGETKTAVKESLMREQGYICCYCERRLEESDSHIEHFMPQRDPGVDPLDYANLLCSCQNQLKKGEPRHCGNLKDSWFDPYLLISPLNPNCESRFKFTFDGRILPRNDDDEAAPKTIDKLGLGIPKLNALRKAAIDPFLKEDLSSDELHLLVNGYLKKDSVSGQWGEFWTTIQYLFADQDAA